MAKFNDDDFYAIRNWVLDGCICVRSQLTYRFQDRYPNTFCLIWVRPQIPRFIGVGPDCAAWACLDIHYDKDGTFVALGGFWINGVYNLDIKPEQEFWEHGGQHCKEAYVAMRGLVPTQAPQSEGHVTYDTYVNSLRAHEQVMKKLRG